MRGGPWARMEVKCCRDNAACITCGTCNPAVILARVRYSVGALSGYPRFVKRNLSLERPDVLLVLLPQVRAAEHEASATADRTGEAARKLDGEAAQVSA